ncbi:MAG: lactate utilization protein [Firmicutes bacterium]|nr:lactate utilization protein [Alicyclobacillaceae bacterium]MCL6497935.1 lactate utilization protein [Bacillota bacterium]
MTGTLPQDPRPWPTRREAALKNATMRRTVGEVTRRLAEGRRRALADYPEGQVKLQRAQVAKRQAVARWQTLWSELQAAVTAHGGTPHFAATAAEAVALVRQIARQYAVRRVIKSKSMVTEELELTQALAQDGIVVLETDLGEYIIQLAGEKPSHILGPAIHRNRAQIAELFREDAAQHGLLPPSSDAYEALTEYARRRLREEFLAADMGITGGNFLVAETGTLVLITNEGNADMTTTLPRVLVSVVGLEKLVATWDDLLDIVQQPALSGVGRRLSTYTTLVHGPRGPGVAEGPEAWHLILLDNGRSALHGTPYEEVLTCLRCAACLNVCPVFRQVGGHAYGSVYSGPIGIVETPLLTDFRILPELPSALCTVCHACAEACPMAIDLPAHIIRLRQEKVRRKLVPTAHRWSIRQWAAQWRTPAGYRRTIRWARLAQRWYRRGDRLEGAPGMAAGWFQSRSMPPVASPTFREWWAARPESAGRALR